MRRHLALTIAILTVFSFVSAPKMSQAGLFCDNARALFNGRDLTGWTSQGGGEVPTSWTAENGTLHFDPKSGGSRGSIVTDREIGDFELCFQWRISEGGNSGLKYRFQKFNNSWLGLEHQILDDENHPNGKVPDTTAGSIYEVIAPVNKCLKPVGEWNYSRIVVCGCHIRHYLNGYKIIDVYVGSKQWKEGVQASKFRNVDGFGENHIGRIMLQDHNDEVWYKNIVIRPLCECTRCSIGAPRTPIRTHFRRLEAR